MTRGFTADPVTKRATITHDGRTMFTTDGNMVNLLPTVRTFNDQIATFPDFTKDSLYFWRSAVADNPITSGQYKKAEGCVTWITARAQEYANKTELMAAPAGADFFVGHFRIERTTAPLSTWMGRTLQVLPIQNQWIPIMGAASALMEAELGMARAMHIYIDSSNKLVLEVEQSVAPPPEYEASHSETLGFGSGQMAAVHGGNGATGSRRGIPIYTRQNKSYGYATNPNGSAQGWSSFPFVNTNYRWNGSSPCSRSDPTEYLSRYSVDIRGRFGRRS